jgi:hypothetical protein
MLLKKQAFESMAELFKTERKDIIAKKEKREISEMKEQLAKKDSIIAELAGENMALTASPGKSLYGICSRT